MSTPDKSSVNWRLVVIYGCFWCVQWLNADVFFSSIRTVVQCGENGMETEYCTEHPGECVPYPPSDGAHWSGSPYCYDKNYVLLEQAKRQGKLTGLSNMVMFLIMPVLGTISDNFGRKNVLVLGFLGTTINGIAMTLAFKGPLSQSFFWMVLGSGLGSLLAAGFNGSALGMAADKSANTVEHRGPAIAALSRAKAVTMTLAFAVGYVILLQNFTDYTWVFAIFTFSSLFFAFFSCLLLEESLQSADKPEQDSFLERRRSVSENFQNGVQVVYADTFLMGLFFVVFLTYASYYGQLSTLVGFLLGHFQYSQATASLCGIILQPFLFSGTLVSTHLMTWVGPLHTYAIGITLVLLSFVMMAVCMCFDSLMVSQIVWWCGFCMSGIGSATLETSIWTIISIRVREEHQGKIQGFNQQSSMAGTAFGPFIWGNVIFNPAAQGLAAGSCWTCSSVAHFAALILYLMLWKVTGATDSADRHARGWKLLQ